MSIAVGSAFPPIALGGSVLEILQTGQWVSDATRKQNINAWFTGLGVKAHGVHRSPHTRKTQNPETGHPRLQETKKQSQTKTSINRPSVNRMLISVDPPPQTTDTERPFFHTPAGFFLRLEKSDP